MSQGIKQESSWYTYVLIFAILIIFSPVILLLAVVLLAPWLRSRFITRPRLLRRVRKEWLPNGKFVLCIYSDNPAWKEYASKNIFPLIKDCAVLLNWSENKAWLNSGSLEAELFKNFNWGRSWKYKKRTGGQDFNHQVIVFKPWNKPRVLNFWKAFKDYQFGKTQKLHACEQELSVLVATPSGM